jgi:hypothetical protein
MTSGSDRVDRVRATVLVPFARCDSWLEASVRVLRLVRCASDVDGAADDLLCRGEAEALGRSACASSAIVAGGY